jgi:hypothetical protein
MPIITNQQLTDAFINAYAEDEGTGAIAMLAAADIAYQNFIQDHAGNAGTFYGNLDAVAREMCVRNGVTDSETVLEILESLQDLTDIFVAVRAAVNDDNIITFGAAAQRLTEKAIALSPEINEAIAQLRM